MAATLDMTKLLSVVIVFSMGSLRLNNLVCACLTNQLPSGIAKDLLSLLLFLTKANS